MKNEEPTELKKGEKAKQDWRPIWIYLLMSLIAPVFIGVMLEIIFVAKGESPGSKLTLVTYISSIIANLILAMIFVIMYRKKIHQEITKLNKKSIIYIIVSAIIIISLNELISYIMQILKVEMSNQDTIEMFLNISKIPMLISIVILAPFIEEIVFRYSIGTIAKNDTVFIIVSGIVFGLFHGIGVATLLYIFIGMSLAYIYVKNDRNIMIPLFVHFLNNLISAIEMLWP